MEKARLWLWRRRQHDSAALRAYFRRHFRIDVGMYSYGCFDQWRMPGPMRIGRYCSIARTVYYAPINHPADALTTHPVLYERKFGVVDSDITWDEPLVIEDDVWIGHHSVILPRCKFIGRGAIIGAGSVVTRDVAPYTIVAGNPARKLRDRFPAPLVAEIEASRWWEKSAEELRRLVRTAEVLRRVAGEAVAAVRLLLGRGVRGAGVLRERGCGRRAGPGVTGRVGVLAVLSGLGLVGVFGRVVRARLGGALAAHGVKGRELFFERTARLILITSCH